MNAARLAVFAAGFVAALLACAPVTSDAASLRLRGGTASPDPPTTETCPKGLAYAEFDGCLEAEPTAQFKDPNLIATYALSSTGTSQTIHHAPPFNVAGVDFPVGQTTTSDKDDPRDFSVTGAARIINGTTVEWATITNLGVPKAGMTFWDRPSNGTQYYGLGAAPKFTSCTAGVSPLYTCQLDRTVTNRNYFIAWASLWPGCVVGPANVQWNAPNAANTFEQIFCNFQNSSSGMTAALDNIEFGPIGGHGATVLTATSSPSGLHQGFVEVNNSHCIPDATTAGRYCLAADTTRNVQIRFTNSECDGGNSGDPITGPWTYDAWFGCISWDSGGSTTFGRNQVLIQNIYAHDWTANPFSTDAGETDTVFQNIVAIRVAMNCGDSGGSNGCHGTLNAWSTTRTGSSASLKMYNTTAVYPYGMRAGVNTGALSVQGGIGAGNVLDVDFRGATLIANTSNVPGNSSAGLIGRVGRVGEVNDLKLQHIYANSHGFKGCFGVFGDIQSINNGQAVMSANVGTGTSTWTWSGLGGQVPVPYPGQTFTLYEGFPDTTFQATLTDNGNGTSTMNIVPGTAPSFTMSAKIPVAALYTHDPYSFPLLIVSGSGNTYIVSDGSGSGENRGVQTFTYAAHTIMPFGSGGTTATGGSTTSAFNGSYLVSGERNVSSSKNWLANSAAIGNLATLDVDVHNLWMMNISGGSGAWTLGGINGFDGATCPGTQPSP